MNLKTSEMNLIIITKITKSAEDEDIWLIWVSELWQLTTGQLHFIAAITAAFPTGVVTLSTVGVLVWCSFEWIK